MTVGLKRDWKLIATYYYAGHTPSECKKYFSLPFDAWSNAVARGAIVLCPEHRQPVYRNKAAFCALLTTSSKLNQASLRNGILKLRLLPYQCQSCGLSDRWCRKSLTLQLDHINGDRHDNRIENLRFLCPNCHSQTPTFCGKNRK